MNKNKNHKLSNFLILTAAKVQLLKIKIIQSNNIDIETVVILNKIVWNRTVLTFSCV